MKQAVQLLSVVLCLVAGSNSVDAQWTHCSDVGTYGVASLVFSGAYLFTGSGGGVYRSSNNGTNWLAVWWNNPYCIVNSWAVSGTNLFAGTYDGGVYLTTFDGVIWTPVNRGQGNTIVRSLVFGGTDLFVGGPKGVYLSSNNGISWTAVNTGLTNTNIFSLAVSGTTLFAGGWGVYRSSNNGGSWSAVSSGLTTMIVWCVASCGKIIVVGTADGGAPGLYEIKLPAGDYVLACTGTGPSAITYTMERWRVN
jgi:hypothetical protein